MFSCPFQRLHGQPWPTSPPPEITKYPRESRQSGEPQRTSYQKPSNREPDGESGRYQYRAEQNEERSHDSQTDAGACKRDAGETEQGAA